MSQEQLDSLVNYTTCDLSDALIRLSVPCGGFLPDLQCYSPGMETPAGPSENICGPAYTVKFVQKGSMEDREAPKLEAHYIDTIPRNSIVFISGPTDVYLPNALYGGLMSQRASVLGAKGTIIDGRVRDVKEHREIGYTVFARGISVTSPHEVARPAYINIPVQYNPSSTCSSCSSVIPSATALTTIINPGDILFGDINGVVCIPRGLVTKVLELLPGLVSADHEVSKALAEGMSIVNAFKTYRNK